MNHAREIHIIVLLALICSIQLNLHPGVEISFTNNVVNESGAGIYVDFPPIRFVIEFFNRLCFIQYVDATDSDVPPSSWVSGQSVAGHNLDTCSTQHTHIAAV